MGTGDEDEKSRFVTVAEDDCPGQEARPGCPGRIGAGWRRRGVGVGWPKGFQVKNEYGAPSETPFSNDSGPTG